MTSSFADANWPVGLAPPPTFNYADYLDVCAEQARLPVSAWTFKSNPRFTYMTEHVSYEQGQQMLDLAIGELGDRWPMAEATVRATALANDAVGMPIRHSYPQLGIEASPTNWRYLWHALLLHRRLQDLGMPAAHIIELGAGYGGMALYVHALAEVCGNSRANYAMVDLREAGALQAAFARHHGLPAQTFNGQDANALARALESTRDARFLFSAYAFSEFDPATQAWYAEHLACYCEHGFMVWNHLPCWPHRGENAVYQFVDTPLSRAPEQPQTAVMNEFVWW